MISSWPQRWMRFSFCLFLFGYSLFASNLADEKNSIGVYRRAHSAVVNITSTTLRRDFFFEVYPQKGVGSGVIIRKNGYIVTNDHVLGGAHEVRVTLADKTEFPAKVIGRDPDTDLAVIKIEPKKKKLNALKFWMGKALQVGQKVLAIGNPFGLGGSLSVGVISALERDIRTQTDRLVKGVIQTDAAINPGNSGGPLLDSSGRIIGINSQILSPSGASAGVGFAISGQAVRRIANQLIQFGQVLRPYLGIQGVGLGPSLLREFGIRSKHGVMVTDIDRRGPAKGTLKSADKYLRWGFREIPVGGDVIYQIDNTPVSSFRDIQDRIFEKKVGAKVRVYFFRNKKKRQITIKLSLPPGVREKSL